MKTHVLPQVGLGVPYTYCSLNLLKLVPVKISSLKVSCLSEGTREMLP